MEYSSMYTWPKLTRRLLLFSFLLFFIYGCDAQQAIPQKEIVETPQQIDDKAGELLKSTLENLHKEENKQLDSIKIKNGLLLQSFYQSGDYHLLWSSKGVFNKEADSLFKLIDASRYYGLFPSDYHAVDLKKIRGRIINDTSKDARLDAAPWVFADLLTTSAFIQIVKDLKAGRLQADSIWQQDTTLQADFFVKQKNILSSGTIRQFTAGLEPSHMDYQRLKIAVKSFLSKANFKNFTFVKAKDSALLRRQLYKRLSEEDSLALPALKNPDSLALVKAIKKYQKWKKIKIDGKLSAGLVTRLNSTDAEKFIRVALTLDKYKTMAAMPAEYLWVNLPNYMLELRKGDSVMLRSKIICGKPITQTPLLTSMISDMITYPQWTIPESIIRKEILPGLQRNPGYTQSKGYSIIDSKGNEIDPYSVNWMKYKTGIPYKVVQGSGDDNALGVMKFNFSNPYAVYLHDTNQRYLFDRTSRALSHGCVRVQRWRDLAYYILRRDSVADFSKAVRIDSLNSWLKAKKKKVIRVRQQLPLFIRYFGCEGREGKLIFHEDIYEDDKRLRDKLMAAR